MRAEAGRKLRVQPFFLPSPRHRIAARPLASWASIALLAAWTPGCEGPPAGPSPQSATEEQIIEGLFFGIGTGPVGGGRLRGRRRGLDDLALSLSRRARRGGLDTSGVSRGPARAPTGGERAEPGHVRRGCADGAGNRRGEPTPAALADYDGRLAPPTGGPSVRRGEACTVVTRASEGVLERARIVQVAGVNSDRLRGHELGHGIGLCPLNPASVPDAVMADPPGPQRQDRYTEGELAAVLRVFSSGLQPGATRSQFRAAGLIE